MWGFGPEAVPVLGSEGIAGKSFEIVQGWVSSRRCRRFQGLVRNNLPYLRFAEAVLIVEGLVVDSPERRYLKAPALLLDMRTSLGLKDVCYAGFAAASYIRPVVGLSSYYSSSPHPLGCQMALKVFEDTCLVLFEEPVDCNCPSCVGYRYLKDGLPAYDHNSVRP